MASKTREDIIECINHIPVILHQHLTPVERKSATLPIITASRIQIIADHRARLNHETGTKSREKTIDPLGTGRVNMKGGIDWRLNPLLALKSGVQTVTTTGEIQKVDRGLQKLMSTSIPIDQLLMHERLKIHKTRRAPSHPFLIALD